MLLALLLALLVLPSTAEATVCSPGTVGAPVYTCADSGNPNTNGTNLANTLHPSTGVQCGGTIILPAGVKFIPQADGPGGQRSFTGWLSCSAGNPITIKSSDLASLPAGVRATYSTGSPNTGAVTHMPILSTATSDPVWVYFNSAGGFVFQGILFTTENGAGSFFAPTIVFQSVDESATAHDLIYDRVIIRPYEEGVVPIPNTVRSAGVGLRLDGVRNSLINSTVDGFCCKQSDDGTTGSQSEAIGMVAGAGPFTLTNNWIGGYGWNIFTGGGGDGQPVNGAALSSATYTSATFSNTTNLNVGDTIRLHYPVPWTGSCRNPGTIDNFNDLAAGRVTNITGSVVTWSFFGPAGSIPPGGTELADSALWNPTALMSGITVRRNTLNKRAAWASAGSQCKAFWEVKDGSNIIFDGNILTGPVDTASGILCSTSIAFAHNQGGRNPWVQTNNVAWTNNLMFGVYSIYAKQPYSAYCPAPAGTGLIFSNNLIGNPPGGSRFSFMQATDGNTWTVSHNTVLGASVRWMNSDPQPIPGGTQYTNAVTMRDNIVGGVSSYFNPIVSFAVDFPSLNTNHNLVIDFGGCIGNGAGACNGWVRGTGDLLFTNGTYTNVGYVNLADCSAIDTFGQGGNYHSCALANSSPGHNTASDGGDIGVNFAALDAALGLGPAVNVCCGATLRGGATIR